MVRKSKIESAQTRKIIISAARKVFAERGVSRTTLAQVAKEAGVTRGAIYWHFENKPALFFAVFEELSLPLIHRINERLPEVESPDPLASIQLSMIEIIELMEKNEIARTIFEIITLKCEYVDEFQSVDSQVLITGCNFMQKLAIAYGNAQKRGMLRDGQSPALLALDTYTFMKGLVRIWLSDRDGSIIRGQVRELIQTHMAMRYR